MICILIPIGFRVRTLLNCVYLRKYCFRQKGRHFQPQYVFSHNNIYKLTDVNVDSSFYETVQTGFQVWTSFPSQGHCHTYDLKWFSVSNQSAKLDATCNNVIKLYFNGLYSSKLSKKRLQARAQRRCKSGSDTFSFPIYHSNLSIEHVGTQRI